MNTTTLVANKTFRNAIHDGIATITLSRPDASNRLIADFWDEFPAAIESLDASAKVRAIVIDAEGSHFCSGIDLAFLQQLVNPPEGEQGRQRGHILQTGRRLQRAISTVEVVHVPVIAAIQGACVGAGLDLATACDLRYCTADAYFSIQEIHVGVTSDLGTLQRLPRLIPDGIARELAYTGRKLEAAEAKTIGLVSDVFPTQEAMADAVGAIAREIAAKSPLAVWGSKEALKYNNGRTIADALNHAITWASAMFQPQDVSESIMARIEKRRPIYQDLIQIEPSFIELGRRQS